MEKDLISSGILLKVELNQKKHGVSFAMAQLAFLDTNRIILEDLETRRKRSGFIALAEVSEEIMTVRFTHPKQ